VVRKKGERVSSSELQSYVREKLPEYMVPGAVVMLEELPLTPNGKVDRKALPAPNSEDAGRAVYTAPADPTEELIARIWEEMLDVSCIGVIDNFFDLGGHSLLAVRVNSRLGRLFGTSIPLSKFFEGPTTRQLAHNIAAAYGSREITNEIAKNFFAIEQLSDAEVRRRLQATTH